MLKSKIQDLANERKYKIQKLDEKFSKGSEKVVNLRQNGQEFMNLRKENNMFKVLDHQENMKRLKRGQSAYKRHLIERLLEKGDRGKDIQ